MICELIDLSPMSTLYEQFRDEALMGLLKLRKTVAPKFLYDRRGSELFEKICNLPEYYPTRTEFSILSEGISEIVEHLGNHVTLIEFGSGTSAKTRLLLDELADPCAYVPIDISRECLLDSSKKLSRDYQGLPIIPVWADYTRSFARLERAFADHSRKVAFFPGSTVGNMEPEQAKAFLRECAWFLNHSGSQAGKLLIGLDLIKSPKVLEAAYSDSAGVTAAFNLNLLERMNRELGADFNLGRFTHHAFFNRDERRVEMHIKSLEKQEVEVAGRRIAFECDETIHTENSYKYELTEFEKLAEDAGFATLKHWTDPKKYFAVVLLEARKTARLPLSDEADEQEDWRWAA